MQVTDHSTSQSAWEWINEYLALEEDHVKSKGGTRTGNNVIAYDHFLEINKLWVDPNFDFGKMFGYKIQKWTKLISNYIDFDFLDIAKSQVQEREIKKAYNYTIGFKFSNKHTSGHGCLLTLVFSRRHSSDNPIVVINIRSSEVTKRLLMDLLLVERIMDYIYGEGHSASAKVYITQAYITAENFIMYHNHKNIRDLINDPDTIQGIIPQRLLGLLDKFNGLDPESVSYKVHRRAIRRINNLPTSALLAKDLSLVPSKKEEKRRRIIKRN